MLEWLQGSLYLLTERVFKIITLKLTSSEAIKLETYLLLTTKYRKGEAEAYERLFNEMRDSELADEKVLATMKSNAEYWKEQCEVMGDIQERITVLLTTPAKQKAGDNDHDN